jgi:hypothetical protein
MADRLMVSSRLIPKNVFASLKMDDGAEFIDFKIPKSIRI